jgi:5-methyltetrahydrofolate--homocysteine methyltransferase
MNLLKEIGKRILLLDGAMGTQLQAAGLGEGELPEAWNLQKPEVIKRIHADYLKAGSDIITTNTFGANRLKAEAAGYHVADLITAAVKNAKEAVAASGRPAYVALDIGPTGKMIDLLDGISFEEAYELFAEQAQAGTAAGADLILFETFTDISEIKAGVLAAKEVSKLPVFCSLTFQDDGRMLMGTDVETAVLSLQDMGIAAIGINCSLGPADTLPLLAQMAQLSKIPVFVQPNAGLPQQQGDLTFYEVDVQTYVEYMMKMLQAGASLAGGCCGTTPAYIEALKEAVDAAGGAAEKKQFPALSPAWRKKKIEASLPSACSIARSVRIGERVRVIGERINPTGKKALKEALHAGDYDFVEDEAVAQLAAGAEIINVNAGLPDIDEGEALTQIVKRLSKRVNMPLMIDCKIPEYMERAVRACRGKPILNSVSGEQESMDAVFPIAAKYGTAVIALLLDERGIPATAEDRMRILEKILKEAKKYGIGPDRIIADTLALTVSAEAKGLGESMRALRMAREQYGVCTTLGASNVSFGLPERPLLNAAFLSMAVYAGLDAPITDPTNAAYMDALRAAEVLVGKDEGAEAYVWYSKRKDAGVAEGASSIMTPAVAAPGAAAPDLSEIILGGFEDKAPEAARALLETQTPAEIIDTVIVPAMEHIGRLYEDGTIFLPQMIRSADTVKKAFEVLRAALPVDAKEASAGRIIMATVKGDVHDIGKNIAGSMLENYGYEIIDLGKDVPPEKIVATAKKQGIKLIGLSALMTTTIRSMEQTIRLIRESVPGARVMVGGAVLTREYAARIGADYYCANAVDGVRAAKAVFKGEK